MLSFVTKEQYWAAEDAGVLSLYEPDDWWHIKNIQDAIVLHRYAQHTGQKFADIGGSDSRVLRHLGKANEAYCIDAFEGKHGGISVPAVKDNIRNIVAMIGTFNPAVPTEYFDAVFSISVVEHVQSGDLQNFFDDCRRILKPGGEMMHLIDLYVESDAAGNEFENTRLELYRTAFERGFEPMSDQILAPGGISFHCSYATNPDNMMNRWNRSAPSMRATRARAQACTLVLHARRP